MGTFALLIRHQSAILNMHEPLELETGSAGHWAATPVSRLTSTQASKTTPKFQMLCLPLFSNYYYLQPHT